MRISGEVLRGHDVGGRLVAVPRSSSVDSLPLARIRADVDESLSRFTQAKMANAPDDCLPPLIRVIDGFIAGGKRLRPLFCVCGWVAAGGEQDAPAVREVGAALELFHAFALIHDDVMDQSDWRRGRPTVHRTFAARAGTLAGEPAERFGASAAILLGDLCMVWSDELLHTSGLSPDQLHAARPLIDTMRTEIMAGQYLDVDQNDDAADALDRAWRVIRQKTAAYTVTRPLQIGAALAGADDTLLRACAAYGDPLGEAFQLRDDLLGVFGDPAVTGKPADDDLRAGKRTVLTALTWQRAGPDQRTTLGALLGNDALDDDGAEQVRAIIRSTGADRAVEDMITTRLGQVFSALDDAPIAGAARRTLADLAETAANRDH